MNLTAPDRYHQSIDSECKVVVEPASVIADGPVKSTPSLDSVLRYELCSRSAIRDKQIIVRVTEAFCGKARGELYTTRIEAILEVDYKMGIYKSPSFKEIKKDHGNNEIYRDQCNRIFWPVIPLIVDRVEQSL
ncbi:hypothetical protein [Dasania marina]|uniref:hypothetical protein n=1 Tax=Dasania marina TaxID=471499 RepID=UPI0030DD56C6|tara:strand:- start:478 stop:876 length:399 start_codon:yes stop_codon:yes gene_type:complete